MMFWEQGPKPELLLLCQVLGVAPPVSRVTRRSLIESELGLVGESGSP